VAFRSCPHLSAIIVDNANPNYSSLDGVLFDKAQTTLLVYPGGKHGNYTIPSTTTNIGALAFSQVRNLRQVIVPGNVTIIGDLAFYGCGLDGLYFTGDAPRLVAGAVFLGGNYSTIYFLPGTTGWGSTYGGRPTAVWQPAMQSNDPSFGVRTNQFGFNIAWPSGRVIVVEACTNLASPTWIPVGTNSLIGDSSYFADPNWANHSRRFYRVRAQ